MPQIVKVPDRKKGESKSAEARKKKNAIHFYEKEIEKNRQSALPTDVKGYSKEEFLKGNFKRHSSNVEGRRLRDDWNYGVTYYLP